MDPPGEEDVKDLEYSAQKDPPETGLEIVPEIIQEPIPWPAQEPLPGPAIEDNKWYGVPPKGEQPLPEKGTYLLMIVGVIILEICIWAIYRYFSAPFFEGFGTMTFYLVHIIAAPTIHLIPIILFWWLVRGEKGLPFVFTKKLLMSGVVVGFVGAIIWRILEELTYDGVAGMAGGTVPGTFTFFNMMDSLTIELFIVMTFVHFFIVGPVKELELRGFAQDQTARVLPNWQAVLLSSILFGCGHIPIAIFVYQFPPAEFVVALIGWISAGAVFGVLYVFSRNIYACIVMHGMGNWQLSVFYFASTELVGRMSSFTTIVVGTVSSLIADAIMIVFFFAVHKYYWQPHRRGERAFYGAFASLQNFLRAHDFGKRPLHLTAVYLVAFCVTICGILMGITYAFGETDLSKMQSTSEGSDGGGGGEDITIPDDYEETIQDSLEHGRKLFAFQQMTDHPLGEGEGETYNLYPVPIEYNITEIVIKSTGDPGSPPRGDGGDRNDIDLYLYRPGKEAGGNQEDTNPDYQAATQYIDEVMTVTRSTVVWGNWTLRVDCFTGDNVQYTVDIQVTYARGNETEGE